VGLFFGVVVAIGSCADDGDPPPASPVATATAAREQAARTQARATAPSAIARLDSCPRTRGGRPSENVGIALGDGPAYPVLGMEQAPPAAGGVVSLFRNERRGRAYRVKTLWAVRPGTPSGLVVRAARYRRGEPVRFLLGGGEDLRRPWRLGLPHGSGGWGYAPSVTLLPGAGCYVFEVRGEGVDDRIVFEAALAEPA